MRLIAFAALLLPAAASPPDPGQPPISAQTQRSGGPVDPEQAKLAFDKVDLAIEVFPERQSIAGLAKLSFTARAPLDRLLIDLDTNLAVRSIAIDGSALSKGSWSNPSGRLTIRLPRPLGQGEKVTATIDYAGTPHVALRAPWDDGMVWSRTPQGRQWIASTTEGYGCDMLWPCLDFPTGEPRELLFAVTVPAGLKAPANGRLERVERRSDGRTTWHWRARQPNTYAVSLNIAPYEELSATYRSRFGNSFPMHFWFLPGKATKARGLFEEFAPTVDFFEATIGPYPWPDEKLGVVETPHLGMEHQTINAYGANYVKSADGFDWLFQHELAHEWFGNQMTVANWDDYWLHEGYAQYMQPLYGRWREGEARYAVMMEAQRIQIDAKVPMVSGKERTEEEVYETAKGGPATDIYYKGAWVLHTLRWLIGDDDFWDVTRRLVYGRPDPQPGNFTPRYSSTAEYEALVDQVTGAKYRWFFDVYLRQGPLPELATSQEGGTLRLAWNAPAGLPFPMPVEVQVGEQLVRLDMADGTGELRVPKGAHVVVDPYARVLRRSAALEALKAAREARR